MPHVKINEIDPNSPEHAKPKAFERRLSERLRAIEQAKPEHQSLRMAHRSLVQPTARSLAHWIRLFHGLTGSVPDADGTRYPVSLESFDGRDPDTTVISIAVVSP
jgi:hypothetical protein